MTNVDESQPIVCQDNSTAVMTNKKGDFPHIMVSFFFFFFLFFSFFLSEI